MSVLQTQAETAVAAPRAMRFVGSDKEFWRIVLRGAVLLALTLGIYRFWLATDIRRFVWSNTAIDGEFLEYAGTAIELLRGFLVAVALLVPIYTLFLVTAIDAGILGSLLSVAALLLLAFLSQYGIYLARRYRLTRTVFRGLRFHLQGSALRYCVCAVWWWSLTLLTLGLAYPFARAALDRYKMRHTYYGDLQGRFEGSGWRLFFRGVAIWTVIVVPFLIGALALLSIDWPAAMAAMRAGGDVTAKIEAASPGFVAAIGTAFLMLVASFAMAALLWPAFHALVVRWWISGVRFGDVAATSHLRTRDVYWAYLRFLSYLSGLAILVLLGLFVALLIIGLVFGSDQSPLAEIVVVLILVGTYVFAALGVMSIYQAVVSLSVWRLAAESVELRGADAIPQTRAAGASSSPLGEGIADVLNLGGI